MKLSKMPKEELELLSYTKIAELYLKENKTQMNTADLFKEVCRLLELPESVYQNQIADFFQSLTTSKEFILLNNGKWDLKINHSVKVDMDDIYEDKLEDEELDDFEDEEEENDEEVDKYNSLDNEDDDDFDTDDELNDLTIVSEDELDEE